MRDLIAKGRFFCNHQTRRRRRHIVDNMQAKAKPEAQLGESESREKEPRRVGRGNPKKLAKILTMTEIREICVSKTGTFHFGLASRHPTHYLCRRVPLHIDTIKYPGSQKNISGINKSCAHSVSGVPRVSGVSGGNYSAISISLLEQKNAHFWSKSEQNRCFTCSAPKRYS